MPGESLPDRLVDVTREWLFARAAPRSFLQSLGEHLEECFPDRAAELMAAIQEQIPAIVAAHEDMFPDEASRDATLAISAALLASYRVLAPVIGDDEKTFEFFGRLWAQFGQRSSKLGTRLLLGKPGSKMSTIASVLQATLPVYGKAWEVTYERDGDRYFERRITKCGFHDFFVRNGVERLTTALCVWDRLWMDEITPERTGIKAERPTTLGYGGPACPFRFRAVEH